MQLILLIAALLLCGNGRGAVSKDEMREIIKYISNDGEAEKLIDEAEKITDMLGAVAPLMSAVSAANAQPASNQTSQFSDTTTEKSGEYNKFSEEQEGVHFILEPVAKVADEGIYSALSQALR